MNIKTGLKFSINKSVNAETTRLRKMEFEE